MQHMLVFPVALDELHDNTDVKTRENTTGHEKNIEHVKRIMLTLSSIILKKLYLW